MNLGVYDPLRDHLQGLDSKTISLSYEQIERILGRKLPASAHNHREWWANNRSHIQGVAWLEAGWEVDEVNLTARRVTFRRIRS